MLWKPGATGTHQTMCVASVPCCGVTNMSPLESINLILALDACGFVVAELCPVLTIALSKV